MKKIVIGVVGLAVIGGGAWAATQYFGPTQDAANASGATAGDEDDDDLLLRRRNGGGGTVDGAPPGGGDDGEPMVDNSHVASTGAVALPIVRSGLWEMTQTDAMGSRTSQVCMDTAIQAEVNVYGAQIHAPFCTARSTVRRRASDRWTYDTVCPLPMNSSITVAGEISGDLNRTYTHRVTMVSVSPAGRETTVTTETGRYLGRCPSGVAGGDVLVNGARMMNLRDAMAMGQMMVPGARGGPPAGFTPRPDAH